MTLDALLAKYGCKSLDEVIGQANKFADGDPENGVAEQPDTAVGIYQDILLVSPDHPGVLYALGVVLREAARYAWAIQLAKRICTLCPRDPRGWKLLATVYGEMCRYDDSIRYAEKALECKRTDFTLADVAYAYNNAGDIDNADKYCAEALAAPKSELNREAMRNVEVTLAYVRLAQGRWREGFDGFRKTLRTKWRKERVYSTATGADTTEWAGEKDAVVIVTGEQGLGDEIMAAGVIPSAVENCQKFIFDCDHRLAPLFARSFPSIIVSPTRREGAVRTPVAPTHHKALFGLSELFRREDADFPRVPYLIPNQEYVGMFRELFGGQRVIGLAWSGGLPRTGQEPRLAGLNAFLPLIRRGGAEFVSLQYKDDAREVIEFERQHGVRVRRLPWVTQGQDIDLLGGLIAACSEVVGVHTSALHLSSAIGVPTTVITHRGSGWRYSPAELLWYPPTTVMHKKRTGESWRDCVNRLVEARK
jgi:Flp pilus assembly protein TadD